MGGKSIVVIQGSRHRETYHQYKKSNPKSKTHRTFLKDRISFGIAHEIENRIIHSRTEPVESLIQKEFIRFFILDSNLYQGGGKADSEIDSESTNIARQLSDDEVQTVFDKLQNLQTFLSGKNDKNFIGNYTLKQIEIIRNMILEKHPVRTTSI